MPTLAELEVLLSVQDAELKKGLNALDKRLDKFEADTERKINNAGEAFDGFGNKATQAGQALAPLAAVIAATAGYAVKVAADYQQMGNVFQSVSSASVAEMEKVRQKAVELGSDLALPGTSAKDAMGVMVELSKAGLDVAESMDAARGSIMLAAAGQLENARAAEIQANAMNSFNLAGREAGRVADVISEAANASSAGVEDLAQAFAMGSSTAYAAKLTIEEYTASLAAMANAGIKGSDSGTSVKTMLMSLMAPADDAKRAMDEINLSFFDAEGSARPFRDVIKDLREGISGLSEAKQADIMKTIFGTDGIRAAQIITRLGDDFDTLIDQMEGAKGSAGKMASAMNGGLKGALDALQSSVQTLLLAEGEKGLPALERIVRSLAEGVTKLGSLPDPLKDLVLGTAAFIALGAPTLLAVGSMSTGIGSLLTTVQALTGAIGLGGASAGATAASGATAVAASGSLAASLTILAGVVAAVAATVATAALAIKNDWGGAGKAFEELKVSFQRDIGLVVDAFQDFQREHGDLMSLMANDFKEVLGGVVAFQLDDLRRRIGVVSDAVRAFTRVFSWGLTVAKEVSMGYSMATANGFQMLGEIAASTFENIRAGAFSVAAGVVDAFRSMFSMFSPIAGAIADKLGLADLSKMLKGLSAGAKQASADITNGMNRRLFDSTLRGARMQIAASNWIDEQRSLSAGATSEAPGAAAGGTGNTKTPKTPGSGTGNGRPPKMPGNLNGGLGQVAPMDPFGDIQAGIQSVSGEALSKEAVKAAEKVRLAALESARQLNEAFKQALADLQARASDARLSLKIEGLGEKDQLAMKNFGKMFDGLADPEKKNAIEDLLHTTRLLESSANSTGKTGNPFFWAEVSLPIINQINDTHREYMDNLAHQLDLTNANSEAERIRLSVAKEHAGWSKKQVDEAVKATMGLESARKLVERMNAPSNGKTGNPLWWAEGALPIIRQINEAHQEYLSGLAHENAMILANSEAERIRLDLMKQYPEWTTGMIDQAVSAALDVEATRQKADEIQDIVYRLTNWIDGSLDALLEDGFRGFFDEVVNGFTDMVADMAKAWIMSQMQELFEGLIGGLLNPGRGGTRNITDLGYRPGTFRVQPRAEGGPIGAEMPYLVGEQGPELIMPQVSGHVYNNSETNSLLKALHSSKNSSSRTEGGETTVNNGAQPNVFHFTVHATDAGSFIGSERQIKQMLAQAVRDGARR